MNPSTNDPADQLSIGMVQSRWDSLQERLAALGAADVSVLAVTKGFDVRAVKAACAIGLCAVGENYAQDLASKANELRAEGPDATAAPPQWHFIGGLQSNKVKLIADVVAVWESVDRIKVAKQIQNHAPGATVYVQMRPPGAGDQKAGAAPDRVPDLVTELRSLGLSVEGIMTVGVDADDAATRRAFALAVELADDLDLAQRSIGMTADLELALEAGSTQIRVGSALFGPRPPR